MTEPFARAIAELAERGRPRGADRVYNDALLAPEPRGDRRSAKLVAASFVAVALLASFLALRARSNEFEPVAPVQPTDPVQRQLAGSTFRLLDATVDGHPIGIATPVTVTFDAEFARVDGGCGQADLSYRVIDGQGLDHGEDPWVPAPSTGAIEPECPNRLPVTLLSGMAFNRLSVAVDGPRVTISGADINHGAVVLHLERSGPAPAPPLLGTRWWIWHARIGATYQFGATTTDDEPSLVLGAAQADLIDVPCGSGTIEMAWSRDELALSALPGDPPCAVLDGGVQRFLHDSLPGDFGVRFDGSHLTLISRDGAVLFFHTAA